MKISLALPSHDTVPFLFAYDLASLSAYTVAAMPDEVAFGINGVSGTYIHSARQQLMDDLLRQDADYILWIDTDMRFPREALVHLLQQKVEMVGINYAQRGVPSDYVAIKTVGLGDAGVKCATTDESEGLEEVEALGFGMVLMKTRALKNMPNPLEVPWFQNVYLGDGQWMGEDVRFCELFRQSGGRIFVDHDLSKRCRHIGQFEYSLDHVALEVPA